MESNFDNCSNSSFINIGRLDINNEPYAIECSLAHELLHVIMI